MEHRHHLKKRERTHRAIMHSAKLLFEKKGIGNVTIDQISENADISRSTFFTHFSSLDDLLNQIADEEIKDILTATESESEQRISALFSRLNKDTYPYPNLMLDLFIRSILYNSNSAVAGIDSVMTNEIRSDGYEKLKQQFKSEDISAFILGSYFGLIFRKFINNEPFDDQEETNAKIQKFINFLKNQEE